MKKYFLIILFIVVLFLYFPLYAQTPTITITSPHGGENWHKGSSYTISWTKSGNMNAYVKIRLYQGSTKVLNIIDSTPNNGSYTWQIPLNVSPGTYYIRVKTVDNLVYDNSDVITISEQPAPTITIVSPHSGDIWFKNTQYTISWAKSGNMNPNVKIRLMKNGIKILGIIDNTANNGSFSWTIPSSLPAGTYKIRVKTVDNLVYGDSESFTISEKPSSKITITSPQIGTVWHQGNIHTISWTKSGDMNPNVKIILLKAKRSRSALVAAGGQTIITNSTPNRGVYRWNIPNSISDGTYKIKITTADNRLTAISLPFTIRSEAYPIKIVTPKDQAVFDINSKHTIRWKTKSKSGKFILKASKFFPFSGTFGPFVKIGETSNTTYFIWNVNLDPGVYKLRVELKENPSTFSEIHITVKDTSPPCSIEITSPPKSSSMFFRRGDIVHVKWNNPHCSPNKKVTIIVEKLNASTSMSLPCYLMTGQGVFHDFTNNTGSYDWTIPYDLEVGYYRIRIRVSLIPLVEDTSGCFHVGL